MWFQREEPGCSITDHESGAGGDEESVETGAGSGERDKESSANQAFRRSVQCRCTPHRGAEPSLREVQSDGKKRKSLQQAQLLDFHVIAFGNN